MIYKSKNTFPVFEGDMWMWKIKVYHQTQPNWKFLREFLVHRVGSSSDQFRKVWRKKVKGLMNCPNLEEWGTVTTGSYFEEVWREDNKSNSNKLLLLGWKKCSKKIICSSFSLHNNHIRQLCPFYQWGI